jgi:hypothetical protein
MLAIVNSDTVVSLTTATGWTSRSALVSSQGFYVWEKTVSGSNDTPSFTFSPATAEPTSVTLIELNAAEVGVFDLVSTDTETTGNHGNNVIPTITTTGASGDFVLAIIALHGMASNTTFGTCAWNNSFTALSNGTLNTPGTASPKAVQNFVGQRVQSPAGATGATTGTWTGGGLAEQSFGIHLAYKTVSGGPPPVIPMLTMPPMRR